MRGVPAFSRSDSYTHLDEARMAAQTGLVLDPNFTLRRLRTFFLTDNPVFLAERERIYEGMRLAGVPEGEAG